MTDETQRADRAGTVQSTRERPITPPRLRRTSVHGSANDNVPFLEALDGVETNPVVFDVTGTDWIDRSVGIGSLWYIRSTLSPSIAAID